MMNRIKYEDKKRMIESLIAKLPFKTCHSTDVVLYSEIFSPNDPVLPIIDSYLSELEEQEKDMYKEVLGKALSYTIHKIKECCWFDQNGCEIIDRFHYFKNSLNSNVSRVKRNIIGYKWIDKPLPEVSSDLDRSYIEEIDNLGSSEVVNNESNDLDDELPF